MTLSEAQIRIQVNVYKATAIFEVLEGDGLVTGNGHHMRQQIAKAASDLVAERWKDKTAQPSKPADVEFYDDDNEPLNADDDL